MSEEITGGCACGAVRFKITGPLMGTGACHCTDCQKASGGGPNYVILASKAGFEVTKGEPKTYARKADSGAEVTRVFCGECGTPLWSVAGPMVPFLPVKVGALDDASDFSPAIHLYVDSAQPWHPFQVEAPRFAKMPPIGP